MRKVLKRVFLGGKNLSFLLLRFTWLLCCALLAVPAVSMSSSPVGIAAEQRNRHVVSQLDNRKGHMHRQGLINCVFPGTYPVEVARHHLMEPSGKIILFIEIYVLVNYNSNTIHVLGCRHRSKQDPVSAHMASKSGKDNRNVVRMFAKYGVSSPCWWRYMKYGSLGECTYQASLSEKNGLWFMSWHNR